MKVLTVGDGDLTLSLALARAYGCIDDVDGNAESPGWKISLTASVLDSKEEILEKYPDIDQTIQELQKRKVPIWFGCDATQLHRRSSQGEEEQQQRFQWDIVLFHHPHLGLSSLQVDEAEHANHHHRLLCHYFYSASLVSRQVHVCLCGTQSQTWRLREAAKLQGLELNKRLPTTIPLSQVWNTGSDVAQEANPAQSGWAAPRRYRNGKLGSRHFLGKYGYRHRRTEGCIYHGNLKDMNVTGSEHFILQSTVSKESATSNVQQRIDTFCCSICHQTYDTQRALERHMDAPAIPEQRKSIQENNGANARGEQDNKSEASTENRSRVSPFSNTLSIASSRSQRDPKQSNTMITEQQQLTVKEEHSKKRLRWFIQHNFKGFSKSKAENSIRAGAVCVDGTVANDSSRILEVGNVISINSLSDDRNEKGDFPQQKQAQHEPRTNSGETDGQDPSTSLDLEVLYRKDQYLAVWKPAGMRTKGMFPGTLEYKLSKQEGVNYSSISSFETSCPGICVMIKDGTDNKSKACADCEHNHCLAHIMTALVLSSQDTQTDGDADDCDWSRPKEVSIIIESKWKSKKKRNHKGETLEDEDGEENYPQHQEARPHDSTSISRKETVQITMKERVVLPNHGCEASSSAPESSPVTLSLTTILIRANTPSTSSICQYLRNQQQRSSCLGPVVGDTYCRKEYLHMLPRSIRNRIKGKLCIGCYEIEIDGHRIIKQPIPSKLLATYWEEHLSFGSPSTRPASKIN